MVTPMPCRYGYKSLAEVQAVVENYTAAEIPLEAIWTDIDYMRGFRDFTFGGQWPQPEFKVGVPCIVLTKRNHDKACRTSQMQQKL